MPELARVLRQEGVLQLMFKNGDGIITVFDRDYGTERSFQLYDERELLQVLKRYDTELIEAASPDELGGLLYFTDPKPVDHCVFFARKGGS